MADAMKARKDPACGGQWQRRRTHAASSMLGWAVFLLLIGGAWGSAESPCWGEEKPKTKLLFLVARSSIIDPVFERSVVLMIPLKGEPLIVGLIVNKPTRLPLLKIFPDSPSLKNRTDNAYLGGPVDEADPTLVFHSPKPPENAMPLYDDVYLSFDPKFIMGLMQDSKQTGEIRLFLGRSQWAPAQLQGEALEGSWYSLRAEGEVIFDRDSEHLWKRLHERARPPLHTQNRMPKLTNTRTVRAASPDETN